MTKIMLKCWDENKHLLKNALATCENLNNIAYEDLVKTIFDTICINHFEKKLDTDHITIIDNGDYQGTLLFVIPYDKYHPLENEYIMTYIDYGSCSGCDALQAAQGSATVVDDLMYICKDIVSNTIKPYNHGWRCSNMWEFVEEQTDEN